jgi:hypothetical protein
MPTIDHEVIKVAREVRRYSKKEVLEALARSFKLKNIPAGSVNISWDNDQETLVVCWDTKASVRRKFSPTPPAALPPKKRRTKVSASTVQDDVVKILTGNDGGLSDDEIVELSTHPATRVRSARANLKRKGVVVNMGRKFQGGDGKSVGIWALSPDYRKNHQE